jgi:formylglycine-generating enzyme required for sulfatase activity
MKPGGGMDNGNIEVSIPNGFWMAETETTQELYQLIMGENPSLFIDRPALGEVQNLRPVENVLWYEAVIFCNRLSVIVGREPVYHIWGVSDWEKYLQWAIATRSTAAAENIYCEETANGYRLPTDNEWAWAAMGADTQSPGQVNINGQKKYYSGGPIDSDVGAINFAWFYAYNSGEEYDFISHEVGKKLSNELNIFDMTGNVGEWTWEWSLQGSRPGQWSFFSGSLKANRLERLFGSGIRIVSNQ